MRIALLGGSFDPIHAGHLEIAKTALKKLAIDEVWFLVAKDSPLKDGQQVSFQHRYQMVKNACRPYRHFKACDIENERTGKSYTIDTILMLKKRYPMHTFSFIIGDDQAVHFHLWRSSEQLLQECTFYVVSRFVDCQIDERMHRLQMDLVDVSSTEIRQGKKMYYLCKSNMRYISQNGLYVTSRVQQCMKPSRFEHSQRVADVCVALAKAHGLDTEKAYRMGIMHDVTKHMPLFFHENVLKYCMPEHLNAPVPIMHGYTGAWYAQKVLKEEEQEVIQAIYHHVLGDGKGIYDQILFIADKIEPGRNYDTSKQMALSLKSIKLGFEYVKLENEAYLQKEGVIE